MDFTIFKGGDCAYERGPAEGTVNLMIDGELTAQIHYGQCEAVKSEADARELINLICIFLSQKYTA